ncbi:ABC transporter substrate-binding protein [Microbacterium sp. 18062]|uniref:ABC transporter substrate-binding protein n=1 Tax=Microbacterium sp. 18062 TaxID=2681410 RepID=UPI0013572649|nr:ABC transporter substrate-binding protein [Microbacterium sp. 18062]
MKIFRTTVALAAVAALTATLGACSAGDAAPAATDAAAGEPVAGGTLIVADNAQPTSGFDPVLAQAFNAKRLASQFYESLLSLSADGTEVGPGLATEWEEVSPTEYLFTLREGVTFHDGSPLTVDDVVFSLERIIDPDTFSPYASLYSIADVEAVGDEQVRVTLAQPQASFIRLMAQPWSGGIVNEAWVESRTADEIKTQENGTGPFTLASFQEGAVIETVAFEDYWDEGLPYLDGVNYRLIADETTIVQALTSGQVQMGQVQIPTNRSAVEAAGLSIGDSPSTGTQWMAMNTLDGPLADIDVRRAFSLALDREQIIETVTFGTGSLASVVPPGDPLGCVMTDESPYYERDVEAAKDLLAQAGSPTPTVTIQLGDSAKTGIQAAQLMKEQVAEAGIDLEIKTVPFNEQVSSVLSADWGSDMVHLTSVLNADPSQYVSLWFEQGSPTTHVDDAELWSMMDAAKADIDGIEARAADYQEICDYIADNVYMVVPYAAPVAWDVWSSDLHGFTADVTNTRLYLKEAWLS